MQCILRAAVAAGLLTGWAFQVAAQPDVLLSDLLLPKDAIEVVDSAYGRAVVAHLADLLLSKADRACRDKRKLGTEGYRAEARKLLIDYFPAVRKFWADSIESQGFRIAFEQKFGAGSLAEWKAMFADPVIRKRLGIMHPEQIDAMVEDVAVVISQASIVVNRVPIQFGFTSTGDHKLGSLVGTLGEEITARLQAFDAANPSPLVRRFDDMMAEWRSVDTVTHENPSSPRLKLGPADIIQGLPARLQQICLN
jgi:hypothetical protein